MRAAEIELLLPEVLRRTVLPGSPMDALVAVMEELHRPAEATLAGIAEVFDPLRCPPEFVAMLARWVDLARLDESPAGRLGPERLRLLVELTAELGRTRGTEQGLSRLIEIATGVEIQLVATGPFAATLLVPTAAAARLELIRHIAEQEKPAHLLLEVRLAGEAPVDAPPAAAEGRPA